MNKGPFYCIVIAHKSNLDEAIYNRMGGIYEVLEMSAPSINLFGYVAVTLKFKFIEKKQPKQMKTEE